MLSVVYGRRDYLFGSGRLSAVLKVVTAIFAVWALTLTVFFENPLEIIQSNWFITPVAFVAAAFANATAIGGGFLFVPLFIFGFDLTAIASLKLSLATQAFGMTSGAIGWSKKFIVGKALLIAAIASGLGMYFGTYEVVISNAMVKSMFAWVSLAIFVVILLEILYGNRSHGERIENDSLIKSGLFAVACFAGGMVTAWTAIGIGEVVALYLLFVYRIRIEAAIGTGVAALAIDSILGFAFHSQVGGIVYEYLIFTAPGVMLGGFFGARLGRMVEEAMHVRRQERSDTVLTNHSPLKWLFAIVILIDGLAMLGQAYLF